MIEEFRHDRLTSVAGLPVYEFSPAHREDLEGGAIPDDIEGWAWRVGIVAYDAPGFADTFAELLESVDTTRIKALILGNWWGDGDIGPSAEQATGLLIENASRFPAVEGLFLGDMNSDQIEVSWIVQGDPGPVLAAFPRLRRFGLRGTTSLTLEPFGHACLQELTVQGGGLPPDAVRAIAQSSLPALTGIDLYLGTPEYNGGATPEDLSRILAGDAFPALCHLGLRNAENADEIAAALAHAPVVARLESLDLSLGNLSDDGVAALLAGQPLTHLAALDLHHHFLSDEMMQRVRNALPGVEVNLDEQHVPDADDDGFRYIAVAE